MKYNLIILSIFVSLVSTIQAQQIQTIGLSVQVGLPKWELVEGGSSNASFLYHISYTQTITRRLGFATGIGLDKEKYKSPYIGLWPTVTKEHYSVNFPVSLYVEQRFLSFFRIRASAGVALRVSIKAQTIQTWENYQQTTNTSESYRFMNITPTAKFTILVGTKIPVSLFYQIANGYPQTLTGSYFQMYKSFGLDISWKL